MEARSAFMGAHRPSCPAPASAWTPGSRRVPGELYGDPADQSPDVFPRFGAPLQLDHHRCETLVRDRGASAVRAEERQHRCRSGALIPIGKDMSLDDVHRVSRCQFLETLVIGVLDGLRRSVHALVGGPARSAAASAAGPRGAAYEGV